MPKTPQEIRTIYDKIMDGELPDSKLPDGKIFRAEGVDITAGGVKVVHKGVEPEDKIIEVVETMLQMVQRDDMPEMISALASHYLFEYAHPFYDGNGRTGRYLLALFLSEALSVPTVLSLSRAIAENRDVYKRQSCGLSRWMRSTKSPCAPFSSCGGHAAMLPYPCR